MAEVTQSCPVDPVDPIKLESPLATAANQTDDVLNVSADRIESIKDDKVTLTGNVVIVRGGQRIVADKVIYDKSSKTLDARGNVRLENTNGDRFFSSSTFLDLESNTGFSEIGDFTLRRGRGRGNAERIVFVAKGRIKLKVARFTTCPANKEDWYLKASEIEINLNTSTGTARNARLRLKGVPIFYTPYMSFPLGDNRRSGFLLPEFGNTDSVGTYLTVPYYWNIAPNYDATFRPRYMSRRGVQLQSEFRYMGRQYQGIADLEVLPYDAVAGNSRLGASYQHQQRFGPNWTAKADIGWVSDPDYFNDFSTQFLRTSQTHLPQTIETTYQKNDWKLAMSVSGFQTVDKSVAATDYPFIRLPQLAADWRPPVRNGRMNYEFRSSATDFRHDTKESARRLHLRPSVSFPMTTEYGYFIPRFSLYSTSYIDRTVFADASVTVPVGSIDSGLTFERTVNSSAGSMIQTLEPRLFFVSVPYTFQDTLPIFDTSIPTFTFDSLFQENRFIGSDRVGDGQQVVLALTSRLIDDESGRERVSASIGQTVYFTDRLVNIPIGTATNNRSDVAAEISARLGQRWYLRSTVQWRPQTGSVERNNQYLQYQPGKDSIINLGYRFANGTQELVDVSTQWPLTKNWTLVARSQYSLKDNQNQASYAGLLYKSCCWSFRTTVSRRIDQNSVQLNSVAFQINFSGLAGIETNVDGESPLRQSVFN
ncbi:MAG: LPS-assembly protein LptD [Acidiferrobacterales bacterium]